MDSLSFLIIAAALLAFGLFSKSLSRSAVTPAMAFTLFGLAVGPAWLDLVPLNLEHEFVKVFCELTLALILFTDATRIDVLKLRSDHSLPVRLLAVGLPLCIVFGALPALLLFPAMGLLQALVLSTALAPTDAALGQAVVTSKRLPVRIRQALNVESGLNDGIALPVFLIFLSAAGIGDEVRTASYWLRFVSLQLLLGPAAGWLVGHFGGRLVTWVTERDMMSETFQRISALALALLAYSLADQIGGNGFIAAFTAGLALSTRGEGLRNRLYEFNETEGQLMTLLVFFIFGGLMLPEALAAFTWRTALYAVLSLTVVRMLAASLSMLGLGVKWPTHLFIGWFGPRGLASILYVFLLLEGSGLPGTKTIFSAAMTCVLFSVFAHGVSAEPLSKLYGNWTEGLHRKASEREHAPQHPPRFTPPGNGGK